jgi:hypothetical protein
MVRIRKSFLCKEKMDIVVGGFSLFNANWANYTNGANKKELFLKEKGVQLVFKKHKILIRIIR